jgi:hypothetical protein
MAVLLKANYRFHVILIKIPITFFTEKNPKIHMDTQKTLKSQNNPEQKEPKHILEKRQSLQQMLLGKLDIHI